ncbi:hypothetical protein HO173_007556 [Letharia columbiana]|uniref:C2H2-type domain-containing protein n=1 Tax=Letharia columbiana TaxID=112416 RepID=A0A8H6L3F1_9LECA|nr:uncharacterized protein HO173_007556 [Letharia columbiana]KAF6234136.1 hypothetical protein HO173_007556 [Letharia columbiana]
MADGQADEGYQKNREHKRFDRTIVAEGQDVQTASISSDVETNHITAKSLSDGRPYACSLCKRAFRMEESPRQHYGASHPGCFYQVFARTCDTCKKSFSRKNALEEHQRVENHCYCHECTMIFEFESTAVEHFEALHASQFRCSDCEQDFVSEHALNQHLNDKVHRRIPCQICEQDFGSKPALDRHIVVEHHASDNPERVFYSRDAHGCYICQRTFVKKNDLD